VFAINTSLGIIGTVMEPERLPATTGHRDNGLSPAARSIPRETFSARPSAMKNEIVSRERYRK
jgi:hypothetical protein